jgi:TAT-translocated FGD2 family F420-dependent dehydrogenase
MAVDHENAHCYFPKSLPECGSKLVIFKRSVTDSHDDIGMSISDGGNSVFTSTVGVPKLLEVAMSDSIPLHSPGRRTLLHLAGAAAAGASASAGNEALAANRPATSGTQVGGLRTGMIGYMLPHEQFIVPELAKIGSHASQAGFDLLANSDHFQPWQANQGHAAAAWVTMAATGAQAPKAWLGTTVTCPTFRYSPAVVAQIFASLSHLYPGRIFLGVGSGEALNEQAATGAWPKWQERWDRLIEAMEIIRALWSGNDVSHKGRHYAVDAKLYDPPARRIPLLAAANGKKSIRLAGKYADGLVTDPLTWKKHKAEWEAGAQEAGKDPSNMPVLVEQYVVVGGQSEVQQAAELWRFGPKAFKDYFNISEPAAIQRAAENELSVEKVVEDWTVGTDPASHIAKVRELWESGATIVNIHSGQTDQRKVIDFYGSKVLPNIGKA